MMKTIIVIAMLAALALSMHFGAKEHTILDTFEVHPEYEHVKFTAYGREWVVDLKRAPAVSEEVEINAFEGRVRGEEETTLAHFNFLGEHLDGVIETEDELYWIDLHPETGEVAIYKESDLDHEMAKAEMPALDEPLVADFDGEFNMSTSERAEAAERPSQYKVYMLWDNNAPQFVGDFRSVSLGLFSTLNTMVNGPQGMPLYSVTPLNAVRCNGQFTDTSSALAWLKGWTASNRLRVPGANIVAMMCGYNFGGRAYLGTACRNYSPEWKTGVSGATVWPQYNQWSRAYSLRILAHENGHNLGAPHYMHGCYIMDYCYPRGSFATMVGRYSATTLSNMRNAGCL